LIALLVLAMAPTASAAPTWLGAVPVSSPANSADDGEAAFSPQGDLTVVFDGSDGANDRTKTVFRAAGGSFGAEQTISAAGEDALESQVAVDQQGNAIAVWQRYDGSFDRVQAAFRPAGGTFEAPKTLSDPLQSASLPQIAFDSSGNAIAIWTRSDGADGRTQFSFRPAGGSFGSAQTISGAGLDANEPQIAFDPAGNALAVWDSFDGGEQRIQASLRPAGGSFGTPQPISAAGGDAQEPQPAFDPKGNAIVAWSFNDGAISRAQAAFRPAGGSFEPAKTISGPSVAGQDANNVSVALDLQGNAIVIWDRSDTANSRIETAFRPAGGSFEPAKTISDASKDAFDPQVAFAPSGNAIALWHRSDGTDDRAQAAVRPAGGGFAAAETISASGGDADDNKLAVDGQGNAAAVWTRPADTAIEVAGFDAAGPMLRNLLLPATNLPGTGLSFSVNPVDVWSGVASTGWSFGDGGSAPGTAVKHTYAVDGTFKGSVNSTDTLANVSSQAFTVADKTQPSVSGFAIASPFAVGSKSTAKIAARKRTRRGSAFRYKLSEKATVVITIERPRPGRKLGKKCKKATPKLKKKKRCTLFKRAGTLTRKNQNKGKNTTKFSGRIGKRALRPGSYRATIEATDATGNRSTVKKVGFKIVR
jgi:hypothetical protein